MSELLKIPDWLLAKKIYPGGFRLPKRNKWYDAENFPRSNSSAVGSSSYLRGTRSGYSFDALNNGDLRFWKGCNFANAYNGKSYAACRRCGIVEHSREGRKAHLQEKCGGLITRALKSMCRDKVCAICGKSTKRTCWGTPLCTKECEKEWAYVIRQPDSLVQALELIEKSVHA